ncbi:AIPR family protein [Lusitaniella coriacea LEGE 07157]|uniref:AIPR family protein n=1 Tax=Lusitaniella coriacea LEGE 07157 TaxID=945747 RepID=A0A8J7DYL0_9CYAN|nr:AIPR family protein [Lusitaniella coriacea]MBE9117937.1 AIPR family protein [Lusitaniella coriacea LEGE 07157]
MKKPSLDRITTDFIRKFLDAYEIEQESISKDFEKFSSYCAIKQHYSSHFESEDIDNISVGETSDTGIDAVGIIIDNKLVDSVEDIDLLIDGKENVQILFIFVQSTISHQFKSTKFRDFTIGVKEFFYDYAFPQKTKTKQRSKKVDSKAHIACKLLDKTSVMSERPKCDLYYFMGNDVESKLGINKNLINSEKEDLINFNLFNEVNIKVHGTSYLHTLYRQTLAKPKVQIYFPHKVSLPEIKDVTQSYIGRICFSEYKKLILDEKTGNIRNVFEDNVRHFNEKYSINKEIKKTIEKDNIEKFVLLNNGITIVVKKLSTSADYFTLEDYQIVNGCQTSHILYQCRNNPRIHDLWITLKIIHTENQGIANDITTATNSQTEVSFEALNSLLKFHRDLEDYYLSSSYKIGKDEINLYYARQEGKYDKDANVPYKSRIISMKDQVKSFAAMFMNIPHESYGFYGQRLKARRIDEGMFKDDHFFEPYYTSSVAHYELYKYIKNKSNNANSYNIARFHILMILKYLILGDNIPKANHESIKAACDLIIGVVQKKRIFKKYVIECIDVIKQAKKEPEFQNRQENQIFKVESFVEKIKEIALERKRQETNI